MKRSSAGVVAVVVLVALAGCTGFAPGSTPGASPTDDAPEIGEPTDTADGDAAATSDSGVVRFYISDEKNAIGDFEHLNVTISEIGFGAAGGDDGDADEDETNENPENETTPVENTTDTPADNETEIPEDEETDEETDDEADESGEWVEHDVDDRTFDLTRLQGDNASLLEEFDVPEGAYSKVFVHVEGINATLENGESVNVKLPSEKLQINQEFAVESNDSVDFVFDITVHKAGNSAKYILTPVISESGTDVPIEDVDDDRDEENENDNEQEEEDEENENDNEQEEENADDVEMELNASFVGAVEPGDTRRFSSPRTVPPSPTRRSWSTTLSLVKPMRPGN